MVMFYPTAAIVTTMELIYQAQTAAEGTDNSLDLALSATQACAVFVLAAAAFLTRRLPAPEPKGYTVCFTRNAVNQPCGNSPSAPTNGTYLWAEPTRHCRSTTTRTSRTGRHPKQA